MPQIITAQTGEPMPQDPAISLKALLSPGLPNPIPVGTYPVYACINKTTKVLYVTNLEDNTVSVIDASTNLLIATIPVGTFPNGVCVNEETNMIYVANNSDGTVSVIDGNSNLVVTTITVGSSPAQTAVNENTNLIYVSNLGDGTVSVIDGSTNLVITVITTNTSEPFGIGINQNTNLIYVSSIGSNNVIVIDGSTNTIVGLPIAVGSGPQGVCVNENSNLIYVVNNNDNTVSVIDGNTATVIGSPIPTGNSPTEIAVNESTVRVYVPNSNDGTMTVIDGNTQTVVDTVSVGTQPYGICVSDVTYLVYVVLSVSTDQVLVIDGNTDRPISSFGEYGRSPDANTNLPSANAISVDIIWGPSPMHNRILIENMPRLVEYEQLGGARTRTYDIKRVQVWCDAMGAVNRKWLIEEEIRRIIANFKLALQPFGIDEIRMKQNFQDIEVTDMADQSNQAGGRSGYLARSYCLVQMIYDETAQ